MKLYVFQIDNAGVGKYRFVDPHNHLKNKFGVDVHFHQVHKFKETDNLTAEQKDELKAFNESQIATLKESTHVVLYMPMLGMKDAYQMMIQLKKDGKKIIVDMDDYWDLPASHPLMHRARNNAKLLPFISVADCITTTTEFLAEKFRKYHNNVQVIPNAIDFNEQQFQYNPIDSALTRVGWVGGANHMEDISIIKGIGKRLQEAKLPYQIVLAGFDNRAVNAKGDVYESIRPDMWHKYEAMLTDNYRIITDKAFHKHLWKFQNKPFAGNDKQPYKRIWSRDASSYANAYREIDIALAPLADYPYNRAKSQLKIIEGGAHKLPMVVSKIDPYFDIEHGKNGMVAEDGKDFVSHVKKLMKEKQMRTELGEALFQTVFERYNLDTITPLRRELYASLL